MFRRLADAPFADLPAATCGQDHVHRLNGGYLIEHLSRFVAHACGEGLYGKEHPDAARWSDYWCHRLKHFGAGYLDDQLSRRSQRYLNDRSRWDTLMKLVWYLTASTSTI